MYTQLKGGAYSSRSLIAGAQRCLNLYVEKTPDDQTEPTSYVHLCTPGLTVRAFAPQEVCRALYTASNGDLYAVYGQGLYYVSPAWQFTLVGTITPSAVSDVVPRRTPVSISDNAVTAILVDGTVDGFTWDLTTRAGFARIDKTAAGYEGFYGADRVDYLDTFFVLNKPATQIYYISGSLALTFDALDFASKVGSADHLVSVIMLHRIIWLMGLYSCEMWLNTGGDGTITGSFPFSIAPAAFVDRGLAAKYSLAKSNNYIYWLSQDTKGEAIIMQGAGYNASRISTAAIENEFTGYATLEDAVGYCHQVSGHEFYVISFPTADKTWCYDATTKHWHERAYIDLNGNEHRHRANCATYAYGQTVCGDWEDTRLYTYELDNMTDDGHPIKRLRHFPHVMDTTAQRRIYYKQLIANMQVGAVSSAASVGTRATVVTSFVADDGVTLQDYVPTINDRGADWTKISGTTDEQILDDAVTIRDEGEALYEASGVPTSADYDILFSLIPAGYVTVPDDAIMYVIGRADPSNQGYLCGISSNGSSYAAVLQVGANTPNTVTLGTLTSGSYNVIFHLLGTLITMSVQRTQDGLWASTSGVWSPIRQECITLTDDTYTLPGRILHGSGWQSVTPVTTAPTQASDAGYSTLVFEDDFTTNEIAPSQASTSGYKWYWAQRLSNPANPAVDCHVATTMTAASLSNGNTSGGTNASPFGGILQINDGCFPNANIISLPGWAMNTGAALPAVGTGHWGPCYIEAYIQFQPNQNASLPFEPANYPIIGWPAFWSWCAQGIGDYGFPGSGLSVANPTEVDFMESFGNVDFGGGATPWSWDAGIIHHDNDGTDALAHTAMDAEWHTYGCLWAGGEVSIYFDNVLMGSVTLSPDYALDAQTLFITLGTGPDWQMNVDWLRVWQ